MNVVIVRVNVQYDYVVVME